ncbi:MAG: hypothetical protein M1826_007614 [Phylliscum demangeonii]|nr:MAG: hypothetical protein M1826_007614 [Phylliscum demangeonii]
MTAVAAVVIAALATTPLPLAWAMPTRPRDPPPPPPPLSLPAAPQHHHGLLRARSNLGAVATTVIHWLTDRQHNRHKLDEDPVMVECVYDYLRVQVSATRYRLVSNIMYNRAVEHCAAAHDRIVLRGWKTRDWGRQKMRRRPERPTSWARAEAQGGQIRFKADQQRKKLEESGEPGKRGSTGSGGAGGGGGGKDDGRGGGGGGGGGGNHMAWMMPPTLPPKMSTSIQRLTKSAAARMDGLAQQAQKIPAALERVAAKAE